MAATTFSTAPGFALNGLKREELIAGNSMLLHELCFGSLGGDGQSMEPACKPARDANFGSVEHWREEFVAIGKTLGGGSGWVLLTFQPSEGTLVNPWAADPMHAVADGVPILALDMYEHAHHIDCGAAAVSYVVDFMADIDRPDIEAAAAAWPGHRACLATKPSWPRAAWSLYSAASRDARLLWRNGDALLFRWRLQATKIVRMVGASRSGAIDGPIDLLSLKPTDMDEA